MRRRSITTKLVLWVGLVSSAILLFGTLANFISRKQALLQTESDDYMNRVRIGAFALDEFVSKVAYLPACIAARQATLGDAHDELTLKFLANLLNSTDREDVYGVYVAFEDKNWQDPAAMPWVDRKTYPYLRKPEYDFHDPSHAWYQKAKESGKLSISDPYFDKGGSNVAMISVTMPIYGRDGKFVGVAGADIDLPAIKKLTRSVWYQTENGESGGYSFVTANDGTIVSHPEDKMMLAQDHAARNVKETPFAEAVSKLPFGKAQLEVNGQLKEVYWHTAPKTRWKMVSVVSERALLQPVYDISQRYALVSIFSVLVLVSVILVVTRAITKPLGELASAAESLEAGTYKVEKLKPVAARRDEIGSLAQGFQNMADQVEARERRLADWNQQLEERISVRTEELRNAVAMAEDASRAKSRFLANMSHELRTPLNAIIGYSEILIEDSDGNNVSDLEKIRSAGKHLHVLINDILDLSKIEAGKIDLHVESFPVTELIATISDTAKPLALKNRNELVVNIAPDSFNLLTDRTRLLQCLLNLVSNACKFTKDGRIELNAKLEHDSSVTFEVKDTGIGMSPDQIMRIFEPFTQADASTTREFGGTGLGLTITKRFCEMLGGSISVESKLGAGSCFKIKLPIGERPT